MYSLVRSVVQIVVDSLAVHSFVSVDAVVAALLEWEARLVAWEARHVQPVSAGSSGLLVLLLDRPAAAGDFGRLWAVLPCCVLEDHVCLGIAKVAHDPELALLSAHPVRK